MTQKRNRPLRMLLAKPGLDGHDIGARLLARALRDAGIEVIYTGLHQSPEGIAEAALQEDVDVVGLSILSGAHVSLTRKVIESLRARGCHPPVLVGGLVPEADVPALRALGVREIFPSRTTTVEKVVEYVNALFRELS